MTHTNHHTILRAVPIVLAALLMSIAIAPAVSADPATYSIVAWGSNTYGECNVPAGADYVAIATGEGHCLALRSNGSLVAWGANHKGQCNVPAGTDYVAIAAGWGNSLALRSDGSLVAWGDNHEGQCNVPGGNDYAAIATGGDHCLALRSDGVIVAWGDNHKGQCNVPLGADYVAVAAGWDHCLALRSNGSLVASGDNHEGQCNDPAGTDYVAVAAGENCCLALRSNGSLVAWGEKGGGQCNVPAGTDYVAIAAGSCHGLALRSNGSLVAWGYTYDAGLRSVPAGDDYVAIAAGSCQNLALRSTVVGSPPSFFSISANVSGGHGTVSPAEQVVPLGRSARVAISPDAGYRVMAIVDNGVEQAAGTVYQIENVTGDHQIVVSLGMDAGDNDGETVTRETEGSGSGHLWYGSDLRTGGAYTLGAEDGGASLAVAEGVRARDAAGNPLMDLSIAGTDAPAGACAAVTCGPAGATFDPAIVLTVPVPEDDWNESRTYTVRVQNGTGWQDLPTVVDPANRTVSVSVSHFSEFAVFFEEKTEDVPVETPATPQTTAVNPAATETTAPPLTIATPATSATTTPHQSPLVFAPAAALAGALLFWRRR